MKTPHTIFLLVLVTFFSAQNLWAAKFTAKIVSDGSKADFLAIGNPSALRIKGEGGVPQGELTGDENQITGTIEVPLAPITTGIGMRDRHMKEKYLEVEKFPKAILTIKKMKLPANSLKGDFTLDQVSYDGEIEIHGVKKPMQGVAKLERKGNTITTESGFKAKVSDFGISIPSFAKITMADEVDVKVRFNAALSSQK